MKVDFNFVFNNVKLRFNFITVLLILFLTSCQEPYSLGFDLILPEDTDFIANIRKVNVVLGDKVSSVEIKSGEEFHLNSTFSVKSGSVNKLEVKGYDVNNNLIAYGATPLFQAVDAPGVRLKVLFGKINSFGSLNTASNIPAIGNYPVVFRTDDDETSSQNIIGYLFFGGIKDGTVVSDVWYYDPYFQSETYMNPLTVKRSDMAVMPVSSDMIFLYGGYDEHGDISDELWYYSAACTASCGCQKLDWNGDESAPPPLAETEVVHLGPFEDIYDSANGDRLVDAFLLVGGLTSESQSIVPETKVHLIVMYSDAISQTLKIKHLSYEWQNARLNFALQAVKTSSEENKIVVYGGNAPSELISVKIHAETDGISYEVLFSEISSENGPLNPASVKTAGGKAVFFGGETVDGTELNTVVWYDSSVNELKAVSAEISSFGSPEAERIGNQILVTGGESTSNILTYEETDNSFIIKNVETVNNLQTRINPLVFALPTSDIAVYGGTDSDGTPLQSLEILTLNPRNTGESQ